MIRKISIKLLLIAGLLLSGLIPTLVVSYISYSSTRSQMKAQAFMHLESVRNIKKAQISNFYEERRAHLAVLAESPAVLSAYKELEAAYKAGQNRFRGLGNDRYIAPPEYSQVHDRHFPFFKKLITLREYEDLYFLTPDKGDTIFTVKKEADFGIRVDRTSSPLRDIWLKTIRKKDIFLSDTKPYPPAQNKPAQFISAPIVQQGQLIGILAAQISIGSIDRIMQERSGMRKTGETYLVGQDFKMRSDSYLDKAGHSIAASFLGTIEENGVDTLASRAALQGGEGKKVVVDYRGKKVLSTFTPIDLKDVRWALIAEVDEEEIDQQIAAAMNPKILPLSVLFIAVLLLLALVISTIIDRGIKNVIRNIERMIDDILSGTLNKRLDPVLERIDFRAMIIKINDLLDAFLKHTEEKKELEEHIQDTQRLEEIGTLAGGIAHDFNNILTSMHAYALIVKTSIGKNPVAEENVDELIIAIRRATELVEDILTFSRQVETIDKVIDITEEVRESIRFFKAALPRNIRLESSLGPEQLLIKANPSQFRQVIMNLLTNAYQAMQGSGGTVTISVQKEKLSGSAPLDLKRNNFGKISVKDTGPGMDDNTKKQIFTPFFTTKPLGQGTGMGLSVVHGIVRRCGGTIDVTSTPGKGACFDIYFPLIMLEEQKKESIRPGYSSAKSKGRILFIDDDAQICDSQKKALEAMKFDVSVFQDSLLAASLFEERPAAYNMMIIDLNMPKMTGFELTERIKEIRPDLPVILTTGYADMIDPDKLKTLGFYSLLLKPYKSSDLGRLCEEILKR